MMSKSSGYRNFHVLSIILIVIGTILISIFALPPAFQAYTFSIDEDHCGLYVRCVPLSFDFEGKSPSGETLQLSADMMFKSTYVFATDNPIRYEFKFESSKPESIKIINIIIVSDIDDFSNVYSTSPQKILDDAREDNKLIEVTKQPDDIFFRKAQWSAPLAEEIRFVGIVVDKNNEASFIQEIKTTIQLKEIDAYFTARQTVSSERNNLIILGLTWAGLSAIFLIIGADILLRIHLRESRIEEWFPKKHKIYR